MKSLLTTSFISPNKLTKTFRRNACSKMKMFDNPFPGSEIGIPLNIFQDIFTNLHYGEQIINGKDILLQFSIGYFAYGLDRYLDATNTNDFDFLSERKKKLYKYINSNQELILCSLVTSYTYIIYNLTQQEETIPFIFILLSIFQYRNIKTSLGELKALYISLLWVISSVIIPCVIHDHNYSILNSPEDYMPGILTLFSSSNYADTFDVLEDKAENINTIPVKYGTNISNKISIFMLILSTVIFGLNPHYSDRVIVNTLFELQNLGLIFVILYS